MNQHLTVDGRIGRMTYFLRALALFVAFMVVFGGVFLASLKSTPALGSAVALIAMVIGAVLANWLGVCLAGKRAHDLGHSAWLTLLALIPLVNFGLLIYLSFWPGEPGGNQYGEPANG